MEQADTRLLVRDQVESLLENVSLIVPAITLFSPEQAESHRHYMSLCSSRREDLYQDETCQDRPSQHRASRGHWNFVSKDALTTSISSRRKGDSQSASCIATPVPHLHDLDHGPLLTSHAYSRTDSPLPRSSQQNHRPRMHQRTRDQATDATFTSLHP
jgi:hypothetical protein